MVAKCKSGYASIMTVLVVMAIVLLSMGLVSKRYLGWGRESLGVRKYLELKAGVMGCLDEALLRIRNDWEYGGESLEVGRVRCEIGVTGSGQDRVIEVKGRLNSLVDYRLNIEAEIKRKGFGVNLVNLIIR